jgi:hypothetical protein
MLLVSLVYLSVLLLATSTGVFYGLLSGGFVQPAQQAVPATPVPTLLPTTPGPTTLIPSLTPTTSKPSITPTTSKPSASPSRAPSNSPTTSTPTFSPSTAAPTLGAFSFSTALVGTGDPSLSQTQGQGVALSSNGSILAVVGNFAHDGFGGIWMFRRVSNGTWAQIGAVINHAPLYGFLSGISLSADASIMIIGNDGECLTSVYELSTPTSWTVTTRVDMFPTPTGCTGGVEKVSISADGNTFVSSRRTDNSAWVYIRQLNGTWVQQGGKLVGTGGISTGRVDSVAISANGSRIVTGNRADNSIAGAIWIFDRASNLTWLQVGSKLTCSDTSSTASVGRSVSISWDGTTIATGAAGDGGGVGATCIFVRAANGTWSQQGPKLVGTGNSGNSGQGTSVALSADGNTLVVGGSGDNGSKGAVWVFKRTGTAWSQVGSKLSESGADSTAAQGSSVAIASVTTTIFASGAPNDAANIGRTRIYERI